MSRVARLFLLFLQFGGACTHSPIPASKPSWPMPPQRVRGTLAARENVDDEIGAKTGVPIFSLDKSEDRGPTAEMLKDVDGLVIGGEIVEGAVLD